MKKASLGILMASAIAAAWPAAAQMGMDARRPAGTPELPHCETPVGTVSIMEPKRIWWTAYGLGSPEELLKLMASRSNCLRVVDRGAGLQMRSVERSLGDQGDLQRGSNVGAGQIKAADYALIPDIAGANANAGGSFGNVGGLIGGRAGALLGSIRTQREEAHVLLTLVNVRTTEQEYVAEGTSQKTNVSFGGGGLGSSLGAVGGGYSNTDVGQVITAAYINAFGDMVRHLQAAEPGSAKAEAPIQTYVAKEAIQMRAEPSPASKIVRSFNVGDSVFPTGEKNGVWWQVDDENGNRGWVTSVKIGPKG